jgi:hypothetical protein
MKKNFLGMAAIVLGIAFSAFTPKGSTSDDLFYWFEQTNHTYVGSSTSSTNNPLGCSSIGDDCVKGYQRPSQPLTEPTGMADAEFAKP